MTLPFLVIVEDDEAFARTLRRSFGRRGYEIALAPDFATLKAVIAERAPDFAVVDLKLGADSGLVCVAAIHASAPEATIVVLTGYASIATAVEAIKLGATNYLPKPSNTDDIIAAFAKAGGDAAVPVVGRSTSIKTLEWEHIHQTLADTGFNISEAARRLGMHRRTLARKLEKQQVK